MKKIKEVSMQLGLVIFGVSFALFAPSVQAAVAPTSDVSLPFTLPTIGSLISFMVRFFFFFAGLGALLFLLLGALSWVTSSGDKEAVKKAQDKIQAAVVGLVILVAVLVILATLESFILKGSFCVGLTCNVESTIPHLLNP